MKKIFTILMLLVAVTLTAAAKGETVKAVFNVNPVMTCQNCENKIKTNIRYEAGVTDIATDRNTQTVTVTYNPAKTSPEKLVAAFKKIGYTATLATPKDSKKAPAAGCTGHCNGCTHHNK